MEIPDGRDAPAYLAECASRSRAEGSALVVVSNALSIPGTDDLPVPTDGLSGVVDFAGERFELGTGTEPALVVDGSTLYQRQQDGLWIRQQLLPGRYLPYDPRGVLTLLVTGCQSADSDGQATYQVRYDLARAVEWGHPTLAPEWTSITGTVVVDDEDRVTRISVRMAAESDDAHVEMNLSLGDFGVPTQIEPPSDGVLEFDDYWRELLGAREAE